MSRVVLAALGVGAMLAPGGAGKPRAAAGSGPARSSGSRSGTFSIVAVDMATGQVGVAVASKFPAVGSVVPFAKAGVGAFATQCHHNPEWGPKALAMMEKGMAPHEVIAALLKDDPAAGARQLAAVDVRGRVASHNPYSMAGDSLWWGSQAGTHYSCQGNTLAGIEVIQGMARAFERTRGRPLAERFMETLLAGDRAGGDHRGRQAAAILVADPKAPDKPFQVRVDDDPDAVNALKKLFDEQSARQVACRG